MTGPVREAQIRARQMGEAIREAASLGFDAGYRRGVMRGRRQGFAVGVVFWMVVVYLISRMGT